jgi:signal transduction histidine kinase
VLILGLAGGLFVTRRVLRRVDAMTETSRTLMAGDLSGRLPIAGSGDEIDRLAENLNIMLERIEALMHGLKEVSDNIAHDLKTPLTRLRNRCEEALRGSHSETEYRAALEQTIDESDRLISTFNALLMIARAESGQARDNMVECDAAEIAHDIGELYEPLAEEKGIALTVEATTPVLLKCNRELVSQALANLVDNAIKYAGPVAASPACSSSPASSSPVETDPQSTAIDDDASSAESAAPGTETATQEPRIVVRAEISGERALFTVADNGPGIPEADRAHAIQRFVRLEQSRSLPGSGLGLSLAAAVAQLHDGELSLEDNRPGLKSIIALPRGGPVQMRNETAGRDAS